MTGDVDRGYSHQISGPDWSMLVIIASAVTFVAINSLVFWLMVHTLLGLVVGAGFPVVVMSWMWLAEQAK